MRLNNQARKEIIEKMIKSVYQPKIDEWEKQVREFIKNVAFNKYRAEIFWYENEVEELFKPLIKTGSTFAVTAKMNPTNDNPRPSMELLQPLIECKVQTVSDQKPTTNNLICNIGRIYDRRWYSEITKISVDKSVPRDRDMILFEYEGSKKKLAGNVKSFFDFKASKQALEKEICESGEEWFSALLSVSTVEKLIEKMPKLEIYIPTELMEPKVNTSLVPVDSYNKINQLELT